MKENNFCQCAEDWISCHKCKYNHRTRYKIINGKEVEVGSKEDTYSSDEDTRSYEASISSITCV